MAPKRNPSRGPSPASSPHPAPWTTAILLGSALSGGIGTLVARGRLAWPPTELLANAYTVAGCLALVGPILLRRKGAGDVGLGDLVWMAGGLLIWVFDAAALARGEARTLAWATPLGYQSMGLMILAVALAAWRCRVGGAGWTWTNVTGCTLGAFWVAMGAATLLPPRTLGLVLR